MFQNFEAPSHPVSGPDRLNGLRSHMSANGVDVLLVPHTDAYRNEYLPEDAERLAWISGFTGSAGEAVILADRAILFVDGRYTLQAANQVDQDLWQVESLVDLPPHRWIAANVSANQTIGFDPWMHSSAEVERLETAARDAACTLVSLTKNPVDEVAATAIKKQPAKVRIHPIAYAGQLTRDKLEQVQGVLAEKNADLCILSEPASVCWLFNIRGSDVAHTPIVLARAIIPARGEPDVFIASDKLDIETRAFLTQVANIHDEGDLLDVLAHRSKDNRAMLDANSAPQALAAALAEAGAEIIKGADPTILPRATKNGVEIEGARAAHLRDGVAMTHFLFWLDQQAPGTIDEITAAQKLEEIRMDVSGSFDPPQILQDISFDTISGSGPNGAIVHYRVDATSNRTLGEGELYLCDSGAQYEDGTTDITRTVAIGTPTDDQRHMFTLVLRGHIALALARFPKGTRGVDLDVLARMPLWQHGADYAHGTGHGVGSYLSVHEGPQNISKRGMQELLPGMIISNEPGYYKTGEFGIRIENLVLVRDSVDIPGGSTAMMGFETLTLAPIDQRLIDPTIMTDAELHWLNAYHGHVRNRLGEYLPEEIAVWLAKTTRPLTKELPAASA